MRIERVRVAYDADKRSNTSVGHHQDALSMTLVGAGYQVQIANWDIALGKGIDDLLLAGHSFTLEPYGQVGQLVSLGEQGPPHLAVLTSLDEARAGHRRRMLEILEGDEKGIHLFTSTTGTGKTTGVLVAVIDYLRRSQPFHRKRILYLADDHAHIDALFAAHPELADLGVHQRGRTPPAADGSLVWFECREVERCRQLAARRHNAFQVQCLRCDHLSACKNLAGRYLREIQKVRDEARFVLTTKASVFHAGDDLNQFEVIIVDETVLPHLFEEVVITMEDVGLWEERTLDEDPRRGFLFRLLKCVLSLPTPRHSSQPLLPLLQQEAQRLGCSVPEVVQAWPEDYAFEVPLSDADQPIPLRVTADLLTQIRTELRRPAGADTRLWLTGRSADPESKPGIRMVLDRRCGTRRAVDILRAKKTVILDATPDPLLPRLFPQAKEVRFEVAQPIRVIQITDAEYSRASLAKPRTRARLKKVIEFLKRHHQKPLIFAPKRYLEELTDPEDRSGHYGHSTRARNEADYMDADAIILAGLHQAPSTNRLMYLAAVRDSAEPVLVSPNLTVVREYVGTGNGRILRAHPDPDAAEVVEAMWSMEVLQAIGRARVALRNAETDPLVVYVLSARPVAGLQIDELTTVGELLRSSSHRRVPPQAANQQAADDLTLKVRRALAAGAGTIAKIARLAGVERKSLYRRGDLIELCRNHFNMV